jgi:hypothetical protein
VTFAHEGYARDYEFSGTSMREHWQSGYEDTRRTLKRQEWLVMPAPGTASSSTTCIASRIEGGGQRLRRSRARTLTGKRTR